jgi:hypothetical protein
MNSETAGSIAASAGNARTTARLAFLNTVHPP